MMGMRQTVDDDGLDEIFLFVLDFFSIFQVVRVWINEFTIATATGI